MTVLILMPVASSADDLWSNDYYRVVDGTGELSDLKKEDLDNTCVDFLKKYETDLVLAAVSTEDYEGGTMGDLALKYMNDYGFGYGENKDCIFFMADMDKESAEYVTFGDADDLIDGKYLETYADRAFNYREEYGVYGVLYAGARFVSGYLEDHAGEVKKKDAEPEDTSAFVPFHDETAPRVVDTADIFTDEEEKDMEGRINEIRNSQNKDVVIFTDVSTHGKERSIYAADFYDYNGYGIGPDYEGMCLFICMDSDNRGWWAACTGPKTKGLYTEALANAIDDELFPYMMSGNYGDGVKDWIDNIGRMYEKGNPFAPEWLPASDEDFERYNDREASRIVDDVGIFSDNEISSLSQKAREIGNRYDIDLVVYAARDLSYDGMSKEEFAEAFYKYNGYGLGKDHDGLLLVIFNHIYEGTPHVKGYFEIYAEGRGADKLSEVNRDRLLGFLKSDMDEDEKAFSGTEAYLDRVDHMERTGRVGRSVAYWIWIVFFGCICGGITGAITLGGAKKRMAASKLAINADVYMDKNSFKIEGPDRFINTTSSRRYSPVKTDSGSGGSSSGRSSYSSSYSGSSGRSHSGSGRSF